MSVLGLLIVKHHSRRPKSTDFSVYKFIQAVIRFLWDAHNIDESPEEDEYSVSNSYLPFWNDLIDLWYLGMQVLSSLLTTVSFLFYHTVPPRSTEIHKKNAQLWHPYFLIRHAPGITKIPK